MVACSPYGILRREIQRFSQLPSYLNNPGRKLKPVEMAVVRGFSSLSESFPPTWDSAKTLLYGMGTLLVTLLASGFVKIGAESFRAFAATSLLAQLILMGREINMLKVGGHSSSFNAAQ
jgi:hypothetical protein